MTLKNIKPIAVLVSICIVVAALLGTVNYFTKDIIRDNAIRKEQQSLREVLPESDVFEEISFTAEDGLPSTVKSAYRETNGVGYVLIMATRTEYSSGDMTISVGISNDGKVSGVLLTNYQESKDFGQKTYPNKYIGTSIDTYKSVELASGVTYSSTAFKDAIGDALEAVATLSAKESALAPANAVLLSSSSGRGAALPTGSSDINEVFPNNSFVSIPLTEDAPEHLVALYGSADNFVTAHLVVPGEWVPIATEAFVTFNNIGRIVDMKLTQWVVGHGVNPDDSFVEGFIGEYDSTVGFVDLVTGATGTSVDLRNAVLAVSEFLAPDIDPATPEYHYPGEVWTPVAFGDDAPEYLNALYKNGSGQTVAHIIVPGAYVPVATEAFVLFDERGTVLDLKLTEWIVGHGVEPGQDFIDGFIGKYSGSLIITDLVTGATGTSGDLMVAVNAVSSFVVEIGGTNPKLHFPEEDWTPTKLGDNAPAYLAALYKSTTTDKMVAHVIVPGQYVPVASEAFILYSEWGQILDMKLTQWNVGHSIYPDKSFTEGFIGKGIKAVDGVDLVSGATGTSVDLRSAVSEVSQYLSPAKTWQSAIGIVLVSLILAGIVAAVAVPKIVMNKKARNSRR